MSVQVNTYVGVGVLLDYCTYMKNSEDEDAYYEKLEPYMDSAFEGIKSKDGLSVLFDGMNGKYIFVGHLFAKTDNYEHFEEPIKIKELTDLEKDLLASNISKLLDQKIDSVSLKPYVISHYR